MTEDDHTWFRQLYTGSGWGTTDKPHPKKPAGFQPPTNIMIPPTYRPRGKRPKQGIR